jgi:hypothetical protein
MPRASQTDSRNSLKRTPDRAPRFRFHCGG